jgi:predicted site-specific integrase-resolvase
VADLPTLLTSVEVAALEGITADAVLARIEQDRLPAVRLPGGRYRIQLRTLQGEAPARVSLAGMSEWLRPGQVARLCRVNYNTVSGWARDQGLPSRITDGGHRRFARRVVEQLLNGELGGA